MNHHPRKGRFAPNLFKNIRFDILERKTRIRMLLIQRRGAVVGDNLRQNVACAVSHVLEKRIYRLLRETILRGLCVNGRSEKQRGYCQGDAVHNVTPQNRVTIPYVEERESDIVSSICEYLAARRHFLWRQNTAPAVQKSADGWQFRRMPKHALKGVPDIILIRSPRGQFVGLEVKRQAGKLSTEQEEIRDRSPAAERPIMSFGQLTTCKHWALS
jgi:hypothetical protein